MKRPKGEAQPAASAVQEKINSMNKEVLPAGAAIAEGGITFAPVDQCIYCGSADHLTREHIIPFSLHGDLVLPRSSCRACAALTSGPETHIAKDVFGLIRTSMGFRTGNSRKRHKPIQASISARDDMGGAIHPLSPEEMPKFSWALPSWGPPGLMWDVPSDVLTQGDRVAWQMGLPDFDVYQKRLGYNRIIKPPRMKIDAPKLARFIAKVSHSFAAAMLGQDAFEPLLPPIILKQDDNYRHLIGGEHPDPIPGELHHIYLGVQKASDGKPILAANVRLFSYLGTPSYTAVIAENFDQSLPISDYPGYTKPIKVTFAA